MQNPFSAYGRFGRPGPIGIGKEFYVLPAGSPLISTMQEQYPVDEDGVNRIYTDIAAAIAACVDGRGDYVYIQPGTYTITQTLTVNKSDVHIVGLGSARATLNIESSNVDLFLINKSGVELANLGLIGANGKSIVKVVVGGGGLNMHDCILDTGTGAGTFGILLDNTGGGGAPTNVGAEFAWIHGNQFISTAGGGGPNSVNAFISCTNGSSNHIIEENMFLAGGTVAAAGILFDASSGNTQVEKNSFIESATGTFTAGVSTTANNDNSIMINFNTFILAVAANAIVNGANSEGFANNIANGTV